MTVEALLCRLEACRRSGRGWTARCPAHTDKHPSLSIREGERGILIHCFGGCAFSTICDALGLSQSRLFFDEGVPPSVRTVIPPKNEHARFDWRCTASAFENHATALTLRAEAVLEAARGLNMAEWNDDDLAHAINAVACAYEDVTRSDRLEEIAFNIRYRGLEREREVHHDASRCSAA